MSTPPFPIDHLPQSWRDKFCTRCIRTKTYVCHCQSIHCCTACMHPGISTRWHVSTIKMQQTSRIHQTYNTTRLSNLALCMCSLYCLYCKHCRLTTQCCLIINSPDTFAPGIWHHHHPDHHHHLLDHHLHHHHLDHHHHHHHKSTLSQRVKSTCSIAHCSTVHSSTGRDVIVFIIYDKRAWWAATSLLERMKTKSQIEKKMKFALLCKIQISLDPLFLAPAVKMDKDLDKPCSVLLADSCRGQSS